MSILTATVYRPTAKALKNEHDTHNYNESDEPQFEFVIFSDGKVAQRWLTETGSVSIWDSCDDMYSVHVYAHPDYGTKVVWDDGTVDYL